MLGRGSCSTNRQEEGYEIVSYLDEGSCDEEEEYQLILEGDEESEESTEALERERAYNSPTTLNTSPDVRSRYLSPTNSINTSITNVVNSEQGSMTSQNFVSNVPTTNKMDGDEIKLPIFNENGLEYPKQHWFLCEVVWTV